MAVIVFRKSGPWPAEKLAMVIGSSSEFVECIGANNVVVGLGAKALADYHNARVQTSYTNGPIAMNVMRFSYTHYRSRIQPSNYHFTIYGGIPDTRHGGDGAMYLWFSEDWSPLGAEPSARRFMLRLVRIQ